MTLISGAFEKTVFDGNTILLRIGEKNDKHRYVYIDGDMICSFLTKDNNYKNISNMGNNLKPYSIPVGHENVYFLTPHFKFIKRKKINHNELLKSNGYSVDRLIIMFQIVEYTHLKNYEHIKIFQIMIIKYSYTNGESK